MNSKLFKPLNEQIQVIKIKRQGINDAERDLLIESIINEGIVESLTEDVELASINESIYSYLKRYSNKAINRKKNKKIGKYYKDYEKRQAFVHKSHIKKLKDDMASERSKIEQDYNNNEINLKEYKRALKNLANASEKDYRKSIKDEYDVNLGLAKLARKTDKYLEKKEKNHQKISKKFDDKLNTIDKQYDWMLNKGYDRPYTSGDFKTEVRPDKEKGPKDNWYLNNNVKPEEKKVPKDNWALYDLGKEEKPVENKPATSEKPAENKPVETEKPVENKSVETNRDEEFEKRVAAETERRYQAKLDADAKKKQERQAEINAKRKATYEANRLKKAAEEKAQKEPVETKPVASEKPAENKPVETEKPVETKENKQ